MAGGLALEVVGLALVVGAADGELEDVGGGGGGGVPLDGLPVPPAYKGGPGMV